MESINELIIGIKHKGKFEILDSWGKIVDNVIGNNQYFDSKYFTNISETYTTERMLFNSDTDNYLKVTAHDIIYRHRLETNNFNDEYKKFCDRIIKNIVPNIINDYDVKNFVRIGIVFNLKLENNLKYTKVINRIIHPNLKGVNDVRFSQKEPTPKGKLFGENNDYINKIYTLSIKDNNEPTLIYDYQYYFNPIKEDFRQCNLESILEESRIKFENNISELLGELDGKKEE